MLSGTRLASIGNEWRKQLHESSQFEKLRCSRSPRREVRDPRHWLKLAELVGVTGEWERALRAGYHHTMRRIPHLINCLNEPQICKFVPLSINRRNTATIYTTAAWIRALS